MSEQGAAGEAESYDNTPRGWAARWKVEIDAARNATDKWRKDGEDILRQFRDERKVSDTNHPERRWNLFFANVATQQAMLYGRIPEVSVTRRYADSKDEVARVAGEIGERLLNADLEEDDPYTDALGYALEDRLLPGLGTCRVRYEVEYEKPAGSTEHEAEEALSPEKATQNTGPKVPGSECAEVEYVHWKRFLWSSGAGVWHEVRWVAFSALVGRAQLVKNFGEAGKRVPLNAHRRQEDGEKTQAESPWDRAEVWEIWDKDTEKVFWWVDGYPEVLKVEDDPLGLPGFFPCARPMAANCTTDKYLPRADYSLAKDLYMQINRLQTRMDLLVDAIRVTGLYDAKAGDIKAMLSSTNQNELYPVQNWAAFQEGGGISGSVQWLPLEQIASTLESLKAEQDRLKEQLFEVTGMSDILRGQGQGPGVTLGEQQIKASFASARLQRLQEEFAKFASRVAALRFAVIAKHFEPASIIAQANMENHPDLSLVMKAIALIKSVSGRFRIKVSPENLAMQDVAMLRSEATEVVGAISTLLTSATPLVQALPGASELVLDLLDWVLARTKGGAEVEGMIDRAREQLRQAAAQRQQQGTPPPPPDPKVVAQQMKGQQDMAKVQAELQADLVRTQAEVAANRQREADQAEFNTKEALAKHQIQQATKAMQDMNNPGGMKP